MMARVLALGSPGHSLLGTRRVDQVGYGGVEGGHHVGCRPMRRAGQRDLNFVRPPWGLVVLPSATVLKHSKPSPSDGGGGLLRHAANEVLTFLGAGARGRHGLHVYGFALFKVREEAL